MRNLALLFFIILCTINVQGNTYYASPTGEDSNAGSISSPFRTISYSVTKLNPGDTLFIRGGNYHEVVTIDRNGTEDNRIVISGYPGEDAVIDGEYTLPQGNVYYFLFKLYGSYTTVRDLTVKRASGSLFYITGTHNHAINIYGEGSYESGFAMVGNNNLIDSCTMVNNGFNYGQNGQNTWGSAIAVMSTGTNCDIRNSISHNNRGEGIGTYGKYGTIENCISYDNRALNIYIGGSYNEVRKNLVYCSPGNYYAGIVFGGETQDALTNTVISNNLCYGNWINLLSDSNVPTANGWLIANNTFVNAKKTADDLSSGYNMNIYFRPQLVNFSNSVFTNNIIIEESSNQVPINTTMTNPHNGFTFSNNCWSKTPTSAAQGTGDIIADPLISKNGSTEAGQLTPEFFMLSENSPVINKGSSVLSIVQDFFGNLRDESPDMGGHEYAAGAPLVKINRITVTGAEGSTQITDYQGTLQLSVFVEPENATDKSVSWSLKNESGEASISSTGLVTAISDGRVTAYATAKDGSEVYGNYPITISNQVIPDIPVIPELNQSFIEKEYPDRLIMVYNEALANSIPDASSFFVKVNSETRDVVSVYLSDNRVMLTLSPKVQSCDVVEIAYTKPSVNPIQTASGGEAESFDFRPVTNQSCALGTEGIPSRMSIFPNPASTHVNIELHSAQPGGQIVITDLAGVQIYKEPIGENPETSHHIPLDAANGIYIILLFSSGTLIETQKLVIHK